MNVAVYTDGATVELIARPPVVDPPDPPDPPAVDASIMLQPMTAVAEFDLPALTFWRWRSNERYDRQQTLTVLPPNGGQLRMICGRVFNGASIPVGAVTVNVTLTPLNDDGTLGTPIAAAPYNPTPTASSFLVPMPTLLGGKWYRLTATAGTWQVPAWWAYVPDPAAPLPKVMPVVRANWEMMHPPGGYAVSGYTAADAIVPAVFDPVTVPYQQPVFQATSAIPTRANCIETQIVLVRAIDLYRPAIASSSANQPEDGAPVAPVPRLPGVAGLMTSFNLQPYNYFDLIGKARRRVPLLDGERGRGTINCPQHIQPARNNKWLVVDNWRLVDLRADGYVHTLIGPYIPDTGTPTLWTDSPRQGELMAGDWSRVSGPPGWEESWGLAIDIRSVAVDLTAPIIPPNTEPPHVGIGPRMYHPDRWGKGGRILQSQFNGGGDEALELFGNRDRNAPPIMTEWMLLPEPWDCVTDGGSQLMVSVRGGQRIDVYDIDTKALITSWSMPAGFPFPEGLAFLDGVLYYACIAGTNAEGQLVGSAQIRKRVMATGVDTLHVQLNQPWTIDGNSRFVKLAICDGSLGPRGMIAYTTWSGNSRGYPYLILPNGTQVANDTTFPAEPTPGPGLPWKIGSYYTTAAAFGPGCMAIGTMQEGIKIVSKAQPGDANATTADYLAGRAEWINRGYNLIWGDDGHAHNKNIPLPWGTFSPQIVEYLTKHGHVKP